MPAYRDFLPSVRLGDTLSLSPDERYVAYLDDAAGQFNLTVHPLAGGEARRLASYHESAVRRASWHPDGRSLLFLADSHGDEKTQLYLISKDGGEPQALTDTPSVQFLAAQGGPFSPDGRFLAYTGNDRIPANQDVLIRDLVSSQVRRVYTGGGQAFAGHWSPDGSDHAVFLVPATGGPAGGPW